MPAVGRRGRSANGYTILPGSEHISGNEYKWLGSPWEVPLLPHPDYLIDALERPPHSDSEGRAEPIEQFKMTPDQDRNDTMWRFIYKTRKNQPHLSENALFTLAWAHVNDPDNYADPADLRRDPPNRAEIEETARRAHEKPVEPRQERKKQAEVPKPPPPSGDQKPLKRWTVGELVKHAFPPVRWHVPDFVPVEAYMAVIAPRKAGKSTLTLEMALCMATGSKFLDRECPVTRVLYIEEEGADVSLQERVNAQAAALGLTITDDTPVFIFNRQRFRLDTDQWIEEIEKQVKEVGAEVVFIGPLAQVAALESENDNAGLARLNQRIQSMRTRLGITLVLTHHARKPDAKNPPVGVDQYIDTARGAGALMDAVDTAIVIKRHLGDTHGRLYVMHRSAPEATYAIRYVNDDQETLTFEIDPSALSADGAEMDPKTRSTLEALKKAGDWVSTNKVAAHAKTTDKTVKNRVERLEVDGLVERRGGKRGADEWRALTDDEVLEKSGWRVQVDEVLKKSGWLDQVDGEADA